MSHFYFRPQNKTFRTIQMAPRKQQNPLLHHSANKSIKPISSSLIKNTSLKSNSYIDPAYNTPYQKQSSIMKKQSMFPNLMKDYEELNINQVVKKKHRMLIIKHRIKDEKETIPNILQIKDSINKSHIDFQRRMDVKLNSQHANLLPNLKNDLQIKNKDYLKQANYKNKKSRRHLTDNSEQLIRITRKFSK